MRDLEVMEEQLGRIAGTAVLEDLARHAERARWHVLAILAVLARQLAEVAHERVDEPARLHLEGSSEAT